MLLTASSIAAEKSYCNFATKVTATLRQKLLQLCDESYCNFMMKVTATFFMFEWTCSNMRPNKTQKNACKTADIQTFC